MKKTQFNNRRMAAAIVIISAIAGSITWISPSFARPKKDKSRKIAMVPSTPVEKETVSAVQSDENQLIGRLMTDHLIDQVRGFVVERKQNQLFINGVLQTNQVAGKYLPGLKKEVMRIQVFSFDERMRMHPNASFIQLLLPATFSSGCVDTRPKKEGC